MPTNPEPETPSPGAELFEKLKTIDPNTLTELTFSTEQVTAAPEARFRDAFRDRFRDVVKQ